MSMIELQEVMIPAADTITCLDDIQALSTTQRDVMRLHGGLYGRINPEQHSPVSYYRELARRFTDESQSLACVLHDASQEKVVAATSFSVRGKYMEIHGLAVTHAFRHHPELHVGSFVLGSVISLARDMRMRQIELDSNLTIEADGLYRKFGFIVTGYTQRELKLYG